MRDRCRNERLLYKARMIEHDTSRLSLDDDRIPAYIILASCFYAEGFDDMLKPSTTHKLNLSPL